VAFASAQQIRVEGLSRQLKPLQHDDAAVQELRTAPQLDDVRQVPLVHVRPLPHCGVVVQHA
jgi:hypothetical protein